MRNSNARVRFLSHHQEKAVHNNIKEERREDVARIVVIPEAYLHRDDDGSIGEKKSAEEQHHCGRFGHELDIASRNRINQVMIWPPNLA